MQQRFSNETTPNTQKKAGGTARCAGAQLLPTGFFDPPKQQHPDETSASALFPLGFSGVFSSTCEAPFISKLRTPRTNFFREKRKGCQIQTGRSDHRYKSTSGSRNSLRSLCHPSKLCHF